LVKGSFLGLFYQKHVEYINQILTQIESTLMEIGFRPQRLGCKIRSGEEYLNKVTELIDSSVLVVVILDGFRPNVLFEFGFTQGKILKLDVNVRICYISAGEMNVEALREQYPSLSIGCFIKKPVTIENLVRRVKAELE
jgi:hypothetical protein